MEEVYPALYRHCKRRGYDFRMVDLRQGVGGPASNRHDTAQLHVETIRRCQESPGSIFVLFLGQKHEVQSPPSTVSRGDLEAVVAAAERELQRASLRRLSIRRMSRPPGDAPAGLQSLGPQGFANSGYLSFGEQTTSSTVLTSGDSSQSSFSGTEDPVAVPAAGGGEPTERSWGDLDRDLGLIRMWYRLDKNCLPPVYRLLPISTHLPDILSTDGQRRRQAQKDWGATGRRLLGALQRGATDALGEEGAAALLKTVLDWETEEGLRSLGEGRPPEAHCHCYKRVIPDLLYQLKSEYATHYLDLLRGRPQVNTALATAHHNFMGRVFAKLRHTNVYERDVGWGRRGLDPKHNGAHRFYTERICSHFTRMALCSLNRAMEVSRARDPFDVLRKKEAKARLWEEIQYHRDHRDALARKCLLRRDFLSEVRRAVEASGGRPLLLLGAPGWGKSSILAMVSQELCTRLPRAADVMYFVGLTGDTKNLRLVLQSLCVQLTQAYGSPQTQLSTGLPQLVNDFLSLLGRASEARPLGPLPAHVHLLVSATAAHSACAVALQLELLLEACVSCPCPLYLEAALWESGLWTSYGGGPQGGLGADLEGLYQGLLARLEREHGQHLVRRVATLIAVSRGGCTEEELLDLLARDGKVIQERDLGPHLVEARTDGTWAYRWSHGALGRACARRYLQTDPRARRAAHADYAEYFGETSPRATTFQPLAWHRRAILPFMRECVFRYEFLLHKVQGLSVLDVEEDLKNAVLPDKVVADVEVLAGALALSRTVLEDDPCQLASQIMGRLGQILAEDTPVAPGDPLKFSYLHTLLSECAHSSLPVLVPSYTCLLATSGLPHHLLAGHSSPITALGGGLRGPVAVTCEAEGNIYLWDLELRRVVKTLEAVGPGAVDQLTLGLDDSVLVVCTAQSLQVREIETGRVMYSEDGLVDVPMVTTTCEGQLLVAFYDGSRVVKVFDLASSCSLLCCLHMDLEAQAIHKDRSILLSSSSFRDCVLFAYRSGGEAAVLSARGGQVSSVLSAQHGAASIQAVDVTSQYLLLFCRYPYKSEGEILHMELFSTVSFLYLRSILCCGQDPISQVTVNRAGTHAVGFCPSGRTRLSEVVTWNLETEDHKHLVRFPGVLSAGLCGDLRYCVGFCAGERHLRLWDLTSRINDPSLTYNVHRARSDGSQDIAPAGQAPRAGSVSVWNLARRRRYAGRPVHVEHGLYGSTDVALAHGLRLYVLTDRGTASLTDTPAPVFQTLLIYDLVKRSYLRRKTGLYIVPCPQEEYKLLEEGRVLLGLSETRDHLILWDLETGYIQERIKPSRKESLLLSSTPQDHQPPTTETREKTMMPWDFRTESRVDREKYNAIDQYLLSGDQQVVVCSYFSHHLNVFAVASQEQVHTLEDRASQLSLRTAALTHAGGHLVLSNYSRTQRAPYVTLWDLRKGTVRKRLRNEPGVCCVAITDDASRVAFAVTESN
ncbi:hypothetical protein NHX12_014092, partial [Muraenolepis orangiensis]